MSLITKGLLEINGSLVEVEITITEVTANIPERRPTGLLPLQLSRRNRTPVIGWAGAWNRRTLAGELGRLGWGAWTVSYLLPIELDWAPSPSVGTVIFTSSLNLTTSSDWRP